MGNLTLGTGIPYDGMVIPGRSSFPASAVAHGVIGATPETAATACDGSPCTALFAPNFKEGYINTSHVLQPRFSVAYELNSKTVLRGGFGECATRMGLLDNTFPGGNPPSQPFIAIANNLTSMVDNPGFSLNSLLAPALTVTTLNQNFNAPPATTGT